MKRYSSISLNEIRSMSLKECNFYCEALIDILQRESTKDDF